MMAMVGTSVLLIGAACLIGYMRERFEAVAPSAPGPARSKPDSPPPKVMYDVLAEQQLQRLEERRRRIAPDTGQRRRSTDKLQKPH